LGHVRIFYGGEETTVKGDPIDPVTYQRAAKELFERLAAHNSIDLAEYYGGADEEASPEERAKARETDQRVGELHSEAEFKLQGLMVVEDLRTWVAKQGEWRRVASEEIHAWTMSGADKRAGFYLDREELAYVRPDRYTMDRHAGQNPSELADGRQVKRGRPPKRGTYAASDAPLLDKMRTLLQSGEARSLNQAAHKVAQQAEGGSTEDSKATRLRKAYVRRWSFGE
jgi:hypothetical protein